MKAIVGQYARERYDFFTPMETFRHTLATEKPDYTTNPVTIVTLITKPLI